MLVWQPFRRVAAWVLVGLLLFAIVNGDALSRSRELSLVGARLGTVFRKDSATVNNGRLEIWGKVPRMFSDRPVFGMAVGNFHEYSLRYGLSEGGAGFVHAHNVALTVLVEQGFPGFAMLLLMLWLIFRKGGEAMARRRHPAFPYALAVVAGLGGLFVNSLTDYPPGSNPNMALLVIEIGLLVATTRQLRQPHP
jgi:O-antigen ligase